MFPPAPPAPHRWTAKCAGPVARPAAAAKTAQWWAMAACAGTTSPEPEGGRRFERGTAEDNADEIKHEPQIVKDFIHT